MTYPWWLGRILHSCPLALAVVTTTALAARPGRGSKNRVTLGSVSGGVVTTAAALVSAVLLPALFGALRTFLSGRP